MASTRAMGVLGKWLGLDRNDAVIAIGSDALTLCIGPTGEPWNLPAYIAFREEKRQILAVGEEARALRGREPAGVKVVRFVEEGGLGPDFELAEAAIRYALKLKMRNALVTPRVLFVGPERQKPMVRDICTHAGAREVVTIRPAIAAALGAGLEEKEFKVVLVLERAWCAFAVLGQWNYLADFEAALGIDALLEEQALRVLQQRGEVLDPDAAHEAFLQHGLAGGVFEEPAAPTPALGLGQRVTVNPAEGELPPAGAVYAARLRWRGKRALAAADPTKLRDVPLGTLHLFSPYARLPGVRQLVGQAFGCEVVAPEAGELCMVRGGQRFLHEILPTLSSR